MGGTEPGPIAFPTAIDDADPDAARITEIPDALPDAWERTQAGLVDAARAERTPLTTVDLRPQRWSRKGSSAYRRPIAARRGRFKCRPVRPINSTLESSIDVRDHAQV